jgi:DNA polymerase III gamma/tau subunit
MLSDGGMRDAIGLLEQLSTFSEEKITTNDVYEMSGIISINDAFKLLEFVFSDNISEIFSLIDKFYQEGKDFVKINEKLIIYLRNILLYKRAPHNFTKINPEELEQYQKYTKKFNEEKMFILINEINDTLIDMKNSNHPKILFEIMLLKIMNSEKVKKESTSEIKQEEKQIEIEKSEKETNKTDNNKYKRVLVNNTIAMAKKDILKEIEEKWQQFQTLLINKDLKVVAATAE